MGDEGGKTGSTGNEGFSSLKHQKEHVRVIIPLALPTTQEKTLHMDITRWSTPKSG